MPKYVASRTLHGSLEWNAVLIEGDVVAAMRTLKADAKSNLIISGVGELAHTLATAGLVDEYWFWVNPVLWPEGPRVRGCRTDQAGARVGNAVPFGRRVAPLPAVERLISRKAWRSGSEGA